MNARIIANGIHTDHPIPRLPFVDDSMLDLTDREQIEAIGRHAGEGLWGRQDISYEVEGDWRAYTTIPAHPELAWVVRHSHEHGTVVMLVDNEDAGAEYGIEPERALIRRYGGYWWDGRTWHRASPRIDPVTYQAVYEPVPGARSVTAEEMLLSYAGHADPGGPAAPMPLETIAAQYRAHGLPAKLPAVDHWVRHELPVWLATRQDTSDAARAVVTLTAPELDPTAMLTIRDVATRAGLTESTVRAYRARQQMPEPQIESPTLWAVPVIERWLGRRSADQIPEPNLSESGEILASIGHDISSLLNGRRNRKRTDAEVARLVGRILDRHTLGLTADPYYAAELHATYLAHDLQKALDPSSHVPSMTDRTMDHLILLAEAKPRTAQDAMQRMVSKLNDQGYDRETALRPVVNHPALIQRPDLRDWITAAVTPA